MSVPGRTLVVGEVLIDDVVAPDGTHTEHVGGSPANVAVGLARLGHETDLATVVGDDERGERCLAHVADAGVTVLPGARSATRTSVATARLDATGAAAYDFDLHWELPAVTPAAGTTHLHTGSIAATLPPGADTVLAALRGDRGEATVSYDPNARPSIMSSPDTVLPRIEEIIGLADVVKASDDDVAWLYAGAPVERVMARWADLGAALVVITRGADGVVWRAPDGTHHEAPTAAPTVVDTVGAGDSFMAGLISGLLDAGLLGGAEGRDRLRAATPDHLHGALTRALATSALTVGRAGAHAPTRDELKG